MQKGVLAGEAAEGDVFGAQRIIGAGVAQVYCWPSTGLVNWFPTNPATLGSG